MNLRSKIGEKQLLNYVCLLKIAGDHPAVLGHLIAVYEITSISTKLISLSTTVIYKYICIVTFRNMYPHWLIVLICKFYHHLFACNNYGNK